MHSCRHYRKAALDPTIMGYGPMIAAGKLFEKAGNDGGSAQMDLTELNEAFASQAVACIRDLKLDPARSI